MERFQEIQNALNWDTYTTGGLPSEGQEIWVQWEPPERGWKVLNIDGAVSGMPLRGGAGGVIRGEDGEWLLGFSENVGQCSVAKAELRALIRGLKIAKEIPTPKLWVRSDSSNIIDSISKPIDYHQELSPLLQHCRELINWEGWEGKVSHCFRETNRVADKLAKLGLTMSLGVWIHREPPVETHDALYDDRRGYPGLGLYIINNINMGF